MGIPQSTKGKRCALYGGNPCPGTSMEEAEQGASMMKRTAEGVGCPHWTDAKGIVFTEGGKLPEQAVYRGCLLLLQDSRLEGIAATNEQAAISVQSLRNNIFAGHVGLALALGGDPTRVIESMLKADEATAARKDLASGDRPLLQDGDGRGG